MSAKSITPGETQTAWSKLDHAPQDVFVCELLRGYGIVLGPRARKYRRKVGIGAFTSAIDLAEFSDCVRLAMGDFEKGRV